jgi:hypothetical protein
MNSPKQHRVFRRLLTPVLVAICFIALYTPAHAQQMPPKPISVTVSIMYNLDFGTFCAGDGIGTRVIIYPNGTRATTGNIIPLGSEFSAALYDVSAIPGTIIHIYNGTNATLNGPDNSTMIMEIGDSDPLSPFIAQRDHTAVTIGGTLFVGSSAALSAGPYSGEFFITFIQE